MVNSELLNFYRGHPVTLVMMLDPSTTELTRVTLGPDPEQEHHLFYHIPRDIWFVRRLESKIEEDFALIGCTVVPGYDPQDIETKTYGEIVADLKK